MPTADPIPAHRDATRWEGIERPYEPEDVERLRLCSFGSPDVEPHPYLKIGRRVRVTHGPFAGWEGTLLPDHNPVNPDDPNKLQAYAFSYGYIEGLLRAAKEEAIRATTA